MNHEKKCCYASIKKGTRTHTHGACECKFDKKRNFAFLVDIQ
jgi:hypothetical protein